MSRTRDEDLALHLPKFDVEQLVEPMTDEEVDAIIRSLPATGTGPDDAVLWAEVRSALGLGQ